MTDFPASPITPAEFFEAFVPQRFAAAELPPALAGAKFALGVVLQGDAGGEWLLEIAEGALAVTSGSRDGAAVTVVQTVADWRGGLWEGRGGVFGSRVSALFDPVVLAGALEGREKFLVDGGPLRRVERIGAHLEVRVTGAPSGDWSAGVLLGPGTLEAPDARIVLTEADAEALVEGKLDVVEAVMGGKLQLEGDSGLLLKLPRLLGWLG